MPETQSAPALEAPLPPTGALLHGRYRVGVVHRAGGMGVVYRGVDEQNGRDVAIKTVRPGCPREVLARFILEADLSIPEHPCLAQTLNRFPEGGRPFQVQEFVPGRSLQEILRSREDGASPASDSELPWFDPELSLRTAVEAIAGVARGLGRLHRDGILHRDLKPANLVWHEDGWAVVVDFGLAVHPGESTDLTHTGRVVGTAGFSSPEQCEGSEVDERSDIYSLGATLWALLPGSPLLDGHEAPARPDLAPLLAEALLTAVERKPSRRYATADEFADALSAWLMVPNSPSRRGFGWTTVRRRVSRNRVGITIGVVAVLLILVVMLARALWLDAGAVAATEREARVNRARDADARVVRLLSRREESEESATERDLAQIVEAIRTEGAPLSEEILGLQSTALRAMLFLGRAGVAYQQIEAWPRLDPEVASFADYELHASVAMASSEHSAAIQILEESALAWPEYAELTGAAVRAIDRITQMRDVSWKSGGLYRGELHGTAALISEGGGVTAVYAGADGSEQRVQICSPGSFVDGLAVGGCRVRRNGVPIGSMLFFNVDPAGSPDGSESGIYWQAVDAERPRLLVPRGPVPGLWVGGMVAEDLLGDGQDEVIIPFAHTKGGASLFRLQGDEWKEYELPISGNDVQSVQVFPARGDTPARFWLATSFWNTGHQGYRLHQFRVEPRGDAILLHRELRLPLGAVSGLEPLRGWRSAAFSSFTFLDDALLFGGKFRSLRAAQLWLLNEHEGHGLCPEEMVFGTPAVTRFARESVTSVAADLDADGRDEIYSAWKWREEHVGAAVTVSDGQGRHLTLQLPKTAVSFSVLRNPTDGSEAVVVEDSAKKGLFRVIPGTVGVEWLNDWRAPRTELTEVVLPRYGATRVMGEFTVPESWQAENVEDLAAAGFRISHADFHSGAALFLERLDGDVVAESVEALALTTQGGGGVYNHVLGLAVSMRTEPTQGDPQGLVMPAGGWVEITLRTNPDEAGMEIEAQLEHGTPGDRSPRLYPVPIQPISGATYRWSWVPVPESQGLEPRDRFAVLALEWDGRGRTPRESAEPVPLMQELENVERLYSDLLNAAESGDFGAFAAARDQLVDLAPQTRVGTKNNVERNGLAAYRIASAPLWLMRATEPPRD